MPKGFKNDGTFAGIVFKSGQHPSHKTEFKKDVKHGPMSDEHKRKLSLSHLGKHWKLSEETRKKMSKSRKGMFSQKGINHNFSKEAVERLRLSMLGDKNPSRNPEVAKRLSLIRKELWKNPEYKERQIKAILKGNNITPNKGEKEIYEILQSITPNEYIYSGDGKVIFPCGCPDFWNVNGQKKAINFNGIYWHLWKLQKENPNLTKELIEQQDIKSIPYCLYFSLVIWEDELEDKEKLIEKLNTFINMKEQSTNSFSIKK